MTLVALRKLSDSAFASRQGIYLAELTPALSRYHIGAKPGFGESIGMNGYGMFGRNEVIHALQRNSPEELREYVDTTLSEFSIPFEKRVYACSDDLGRFGTYVHLTEDEKIRFLTPSKMTE